MRSGTAALALLLLVVAGIILWVCYIGGDNTARVWQTFLVNLLFFTGIAQAGPVLAAIYYLTEARWGAHVMRLCLGLGVFLPISLLLFGVLFAGFPFLPTGSALTSARQAWFSFAFFVGRDLVGLGLLYTASLVFIYRFVGVLEWGHQGDLDVRDRIATEQPATSVSSRHRVSSLTLLASLVLGLYAVVFSLIGFDLIMALDSHWYSTLFGGYFFVSSFYSGLAAITVIAVIAKGSTKQDRAITQSHLWDLGKLLFAFCLLTAYLIWSQFLVTWYGNLPEEAGFFVMRIKREEWAWLTWSALTAAFAIPFLALLGQRGKQSPVVLVFVGMLILAGMWMERYLLIAPSLAVTRDAAIGWIEAIMTFAFCASMVLSHRIYTKTFLPRWCPGDV